MSPTATDCCGHADPGGLPRAPRRWLAALLFMVCACAPLPVFATNAPTPVNVVLLMDSSGSMKQTDPQSLRKPAAKLFVSLLDDTDRASIVSFSDDGYPIAKLIDTNSDRHLNQLYSAIDKITSRGVHTNIHKAVSVATQLLQSDPDTARRKLIVLMSDGRMDIGDESRSREQSELLLGTLLPKLNAADIQLHTIAFTESSDKELLADIAGLTGGEFYVAATDKDLHDTFAKIFERNARPDMIPLDEGRFDIDKAISEVTVIGSKDSADVTLSLIAPDGKTHTAANKSDNFKWLVSPLFDLITITGPEAGNWQLQASNNKNRAYVITNLKLQASMDTALPRQGSSLGIRTWLEQDGKVLSRSAVLDNLSVSGRVTAPDGTSAELPFTRAPASANTESGAGVFSAEVSLPSEGNYEVMLNADSGTFKRATKLIFNAAAGKKSSQAKPQVAAAATPATDSTAPGADERGTDEPRDVKTGSSETGSSETQTAEPLSAETKSAEPKPDESKSDESKTPKAADAKPKDDTGDSKLLFIAIYAFVSINILAAIIFAAIWFWRKRLKGSPSPPPEE